MLRPVEPLPPATHLAQLRSIRLLLLSEQPLLHRAHAEEAASAPSPGLASDTLVIPMLRRAKHPEAGEGWLRDQEADEDPLARAGTGGGGGEG